MVRAISERVGKREREDRASEREREISGRTREKREIELSRKFHTQIGPYVGYPRISDTA